MPDLTDTTVQQVTTPVQPATGSAPEGFIEVVRYNGLVRKVQELTLGIQDLNTQLGLKTSEIEQLKSQLSIKDVEKQVAVSERDTRLTKALQDLVTAQAEGKDFKSLQLKLKIAKELKRPDLISIADRIPSVDDEPTLKGIMEDFARFSDEAVAVREKQLMAGITPTGGPGMVGNAAPATAQGWLEKINALTIGSKERAKAMDDYGDWLQKNHS